jgi:type IV pilus assembly protein PilM
LQDPPPAFAFELSQSGIAAAQDGNPPRLVFEALGPEVLSISPVRDNVLLPDVLAERVRVLAPARDPRKQRSAVLILPDNSVRLFVLDFESFPSSREEQVNLLRSRLRRSVPFDVESSVLSYHVQPVPGGSRKVLVAVAVAPLEIIARYEAPFRAAGFAPGLVTTSILAALQLADSKPGVSIVAKLLGRTLSLAVVEGRVVRLLRCIEVEDDSGSESVGHLYPTMAYVEDQLAAHPERILAAGFGPDADLLRQVEEELRVPVVPLRSRFGPVEQVNAGLLGYLESVH